MKFKKDYLVQINGEVIDNKNTHYVVSASSEIEAKKLAQSQFINQYKVIDNDLEVSAEEKNMKMTIISFILMGISILISYLKWANGHDIISIAPDGLSVTYALIFYSAYLIKIKGMKTFKSLNGIFSLIFVCLILASFFRIILVVKEIKLLWLIPISIDANQLIIVALVLSWLGIGLVSCLCYIFVGLLALSNITVLNTAMGNVFGPLYILTSFVGIGIYLANDIELKYVLPNLFSSVRKGTKHIHNDFYESKHSVKQIQKKITK